MLAVAHVRIAAGMVLLTEWWRWKLESWEV